MGLFYYQETMFNFLFSIVFSTAYEFTSMNYSNALNVLCLKVVEK